MSVSSAVTRFGLVLAVALALASEAPASPALREKLAGVAKDIHQLLSGQGQNAIAIGQFSGPANYPSSSGPGIAQVLAEELQKLGVAVKKTAPLGIKGEYQAIEMPADDNPQVKMLAVKIKGKVEDGFGKIITDFTFHLQNETAFVEMMGAPVDLPPKETPEKRDKIIRQSLVKPQTHLQGTRICASPDGKFAIEILVEGKPRSASDDDGLAFIKIGRGESYAVRLINNSSLEVAARLSIDGLNVFTFSEVRHPTGPKKGEPLYSVVLIPPKDSIVIKGWHKSNTMSDSFLVTEYAKSAAATINHKSDIGTITATFAASWLSGQEPPMDEPPKMKSASLGDGTGFGPPVEAKFTETRRSVGAIRASVSVRYSK